MINQGPTNNQPFGPFGNGDIIRTLMSQLLGGNYSPVGLGANPPQALGPNPERQPQGPMGGGAAQMPAHMQHLFDLLGPYIALLGGGGGNVMGRGGSESTGSPASSFLSMILNQLVSPASSLPTAGAVKPAAAPTAAASPIAASPAFTGASSPMFGTSIQPTSGGGAQDSGFDRGGTEHMILR